jgi:hypothetical protein
VLRILAFHSFQAALHTGRDPCKLIHCGVRGGRLLHCSDRIGKGLDRSLNRGGDTSLDRGEVDDGGRGCGRLGSGICRGLRRRVCGSVESVPGVFRDELLEAVFGYALGNGCPLLIGKLTVGLRDLGSCFLTGHSDLTSVWGIWCVIDGSVHGGADDAGADGWLRVEEGFVGERDAADEVVGCGPGVFAGAIVDEYCGEEREFTGVDELLASLGPLDAAPEVAVRIQARLAHVAKGAIDVLMVDLVDRHADIRGDTGLEVLQHLACL